MAFLLEKLRHPVLTALILDVTHIGMTLNALRFDVLYPLLCTDIRPKKKKKTGNVSKKNTENHAKTDPQLTEMLCKNIELALTAGYAKKDVIKIDKRRTGFSTR